ncbi:MAG: sortase [Chloroflexota bacterium]
MYSRRKTSSPAQWFIGLAIVLTSVIAFSIYQRWSPAQSMITPTAQTADSSVATKTPIPATAVAAAPIIYKVSIDKTNLVTSIIDLYFGNDDGWDVSRLSQFAGHLQGTPNVGQGGNFVLAGHVEMKDGSPGPFANLNSLKPGDLILILSNDPQHPVVMRYGVIDIRSVSPDALSEIRNHGYEELTLITCQDWNDTTHLYQKRLIVHARPVHA